MGSPMRDHGAKLAALGYLIAPARVDGKEATTRYLKGGQFSCATDDSDVIAWWTRKFPDHNVLARTGVEQPSGLFNAVVDVDEGGKTPAFVPHGTRAAQSARGQHFHVEVGRLVPGSTSRIAHKVDVKCAGGYVLMPGSVVDGREYTWLTEPDAAMLQVPAEALTTYAVGPDAGRPLGGITRKHPRDWRYGEVHQQLMSYAGWLEANGFTEMEAEEFLHECITDVPGISPWLGKTMKDAEGCLRYVFDRSEAA